MSNTTMRRRSRKLIMAASLLLLAPILCWRAYNASLIGGVAVNFQASDLVDGRVITYQDSTKTFRLAAGGGSTVTMSGDVTGPSNASVISDISIITTQGDLILGDGSGNAARLAIGANGRVFASNGTTGSWTAFGGDVSGAPGSLAVNDISVITTEGDVLFGNASGNAARLPIGANGKVLKVNTGVSGKLEWADDSTGTGTNLVSKGQIQGYDGAANQPVGPGTDGQIPVANTANSNGVAFVSVSGDGTLSAAGALAVTDLSLASEARGDFAVRGTTNWARLAIGASGRVISSNGTDPSWVAYAGDITGSPGASVVSDISIITSQGDIILGDASGNAVRLAIGTSNKALISNGTTAAWTTITGGDVGGTPGALTVTDLSLASEARGDLAARGATNWARLAIGASGRVLTSDGTDPGWTAYAGDITGSPGASVVSDIGIITTKGDLLGGNGSGNAARLGVGTDGQVLTADAASSLGFKWAAAGGGTSCDVQTFTSGSGNWTKPANAKYCRVLMISGGGAGGSGRRGAAGSARCGGGSGSPGGYAIFTLDAALLTGSEAYNLGTAATGGAAPTADNTDGNAGGNGPDCIFSVFTLRGGGGGGGGGDAVAGSAGTQRRSLMEGYASGAAPASGQASSSSGGAGNNGAANAPNFANTSAGSGGGVTTGNTHNAGGSGGTDPSNATSDQSALTTQIVGGSGGAAGGTNGGDGIAVPFSHSSTGGGGGGGNSAGGGGRGGDPAAGSYGGAGGGGGASTNGTTGGRGGNGTGCYIQIVTWCST